MAIFTTSVSEFLVGEIKKKGNFNNDIGTKFRAGTGIDPSFAKQ